MGDGKKKSSWGTVFSATLLAILVIGFIVFAFYRWIVPQFAIRSADIHRVVLLLLPFVVGILLILLGVSVKSKKQKEFDDALRDRIRTGNLFALPEEEPVDKDLSSEKDQMAKAAGIHTAEQKRSEEDELAGFAQQSFDSDEQFDGFDAAVAEEKPESDAEEAIEQPADISAGLSSETAAEKTSEVAAPEPETDSIDEYSELLARQLEEITGESDVHDESAEASSPVSIDDADIVDTIEQESRSEAETPAAQPSPLLDEEHQEEEALLAAESEQVEEVEEDDEYISLLDENSPVIQAIDAVPLGADDEFVKTYETRSVNQSDVYDYITDELDSAQRIDYDISFVKIKGSDEGSLEGLLGESAKLFSLPDGSIVAVLPFYNQGETRNALGSLSDDAKVLSRGREERRLDVSQVVREMGL
ncbi:MAG: hypothetical protein ACTTJZ_04865 [Sphaerochaetaceae bacterium]